LIHNFFKKNLILVPQYEKPIAAKLQKKHSTSGHQTDAKHTMVINIAVPFLSARWRIP